MMNAGPQRRPTWHDAFDRQMEVWRWMRTEQGKLWMKERAEQMLSLDWESRDRTRGDEAAVLADTLLRASPFFVSEEMCEVIFAACRSFTGHQVLLPSDLLASHGFVFFEKGLVDSNAEDLLTLGFSWGVNDTSDPHGIFPTIYNNFLDSWGEVDERYWRPRMMPTPMPVWGFEQEPMRLLDGYAGQNVVLDVTLRLLNQFVPQSRYARREQPDRIGRRQAKKIQFPERDVTVVRLRRVRSPHKDEPSREIEYDHRWLVSGHWRNQWFPSQHRHRQIWINPYVKGPEDKPLAPAKQRVFTWTR